MGRGSALFASSDCGGLDDFSRTVAAGLGTGDLGTWMTAAYEIADPLRGMRVDGSRGYMGGGFNADNWTLPPRHRTVPFQFGIDLWLAFASATALFPTFQMVTDADPGGGAAISTGITVVAPNGDPNGAARTTLQVYWQHSGSGLYYTDTVTLPPGLWNGPQSRVQFRVEELAVMARIWLADAPEPAWQVSIDLSAAMTPDGPVSNTLYFDTNLRGPIMRWSGPGAFQANASSYSGLYFDNATFEGCTDQRPTSCTDLFDRSSYLGSFGDSPIRNQPWWFDYWNPGFHVSGPAGDGAVFAGRDPDTTTGQNIYTVFAAQPGDPFSYGPVPTLPFEVEMEVTPTLYLDPAGFDPAQHYSWYFALSVVGNGSHSVWLGNEEGTAWPADTDQLWIYGAGAGDLGGGYQPSVHVGAGGDRITIRMLLESNRMSVGAGSSGYQLVYPLLVPFDVASLRILQMRADWRYPTAPGLHTMAVIHRVSILQGLDCSFGSGGGGLGPTATGRMG